MNTKTDPFFVIKKRLLFIGLFLFLSCIFTQRDCLAGRIISQKSRPKLTPELFQRGEALYQKQCAVCHGPQGGADGKAAYLLYPKPRDFIRDKFRLVSTTNMQVTEDDLFKAITRGMPGSAMPSWEHLTEEDRWALLYYVYYLAEVKNYEQSGEITEAMKKEGIPWAIKEKIIKKPIDPQTQIAVPREPALTKQALKRGRELFVASCAGCHGPEGRGDGQQAMVDNLGYPLKPRDLTAGIYKGAATSDELYRRMVGGMPGTPMPSYLEVFNEEQIWDLIHYVQSLSDPQKQERVRLKQSQIVAKRRKGPIEKDPTSKKWLAIKPIFVALTPLWWRNNYIEGVEVRAFHNGEKLAIHLSWTDKTQDNNIVRVQSFSDGAALQFSREEDPAFFGMGEPGHLVHIWHWKAAWEQTALERQDVETHYSHMGVDWYGSQKDYQQGTRGEGEQLKVLFHDPKFITGWGAGNPVSDPQREKAEVGASEGVGTYTAQRPKMEKVEAHGLWREGTWNVVFIRSLKSSEEGTLQLREGEITNIAFAVWDGFGEDRNGQKMVSIWNKLLLEK